MGLSFRIYLIAQDDVICRLAQAKFDRMSREPAAHRLPMFASQRVRMASVIVELAGGAPVRVARTTYAVVAFDREGRLDAGRFRR